MPDNTFNGDETTLDVIGAAALALADAMFEVQNHDRSDAAALCLIHDEPGVSIDELATLVGLAHSSTVRLVDRLEAAVLVRRTNSGPGRRVGLSLTGRGRKAAEASQRARHAVLSLAVQGLDAEALGVLKRLAKTMVMNISKNQTEINRACRLCDQESCVIAGCPLPGNKRPAT